MTDIPVMKMITSLAVWRIYPSWLNDKLQACEGLGHFGMFWARLSMDDFRSKIELSLFFPEFCSFRRVFCFPRFCKIWRQTFERWAFGFDNVLKLFLKLHSVTGHLFANSDYDLGCFFEDYFSFSKADPVLLAWQLWWFSAWAKHFGDGTSKVEWKLHFRALARSSAEQPSIAIAIVTSRLRRSTVQKRKSRKKSACDCAKCQAFIIFKTSQLWRTCFRPDIDVATVLHFALFV